MGQLEGMILLSRLFDIALISMIIIMLVDCVAMINEVMRSEFKEQNAKTQWVLIILFLGPIGTWMYRCNGRKQRTKQTEKTLTGMIRPAEERTTEGKWF